MVVPYLDTPRGCKYVSPSLSSMLNRSMIDIQNHLTSIYQYITSDAFMLVLEGLVQIVTSVYFANNFVIPVYAIPPLRAPKRGGLKGYAYDHVHNTLVLKLVHTIILLGDLLTYHTHDISTLRVDQAIRSRVLLQKSLELFCDYPCSAKQWAVLPI